jgi:trehalose 6-phosphate phosphatase
MTPPVRGVPRLLSLWDRVAAKIRGHSHVVVFLDFDGTLVAIAPRPELVRLTSAARKILRRLARHPRVTLVMISGRRRSELLKHVGVRGIHYFGLYGWERGASSSLPPRIRAALRRAQTQLQQHLRAYPDAWIENKRSGLSVHLLDVPATDQPRVRRQLRAWLKPFRKSLRSAENILDVDVLPRSFPGKGRAVRRFLAQPAYRRALPFYFGDDFSDESAFAAVHRGISVHVGKGGATRARYAVRNPTEVAAALAKLEKVLSEPER